MGKSYSVDLRLCVLAAIDGGLSKMQAHRTFNISRRTIDDWLTLREQTGQVQVIPKRAGRKGLHEHKAFEGFIVQHQHLGTDEGGVARREEAEREPDELFQSVARDGLHAQKKSYLYSERRDHERRDHERQLFAQQIAQVAVSERVYLDEAGVEDTLDYAWGWSLKGTRCMAQKRGHRTQRVSMIAAWCQGQVLAPFTFEGYCL